MIYIISQLRNQKISMSHIKIRVYIIQNNLSFLISALKQKKIFKAIKNLIQVKF